jgi:hypothetical protein
MTAIQRWFTVLIVALWTIGTGSLFASAELVGLWLMNEGQGDTIADNSGNDHTGKILGGVAWVDGQYGKALEFDGASGEVRIPNSDELNVEHFTVMAWINVPKVIGDWQIIVTHGVAPLRNFGFYVNKTGAIHHSFSIKNGTWNSIDGTTIITDGKWHHVCMTYDRKNFRLYVDGNIDKETQQNEKSDTVTDAVAIGGYAESPVAAWLKGKIDEVAVYNHAMTKDEIKNAMEGFKPATVESKGKLSTVWAQMKLGY